MISIEIFFKWVGYFNFFNVIVVEIYIYIEYEVREIYDCYG